MPISVSRDLSVHCLWSLAWARRRRALLDGVFDAPESTVQKIGRTKKGVRRSKLSYLGTKIYYFAQETGKWGMMERSIY